MQTLYIWIILSLLYPLLLLAIPYRLYRNTSPRMAKFHLAMIGKETARKLYVHILLMLLLAFHYVYICGHFGEYGVLLSTILAVSLFSFKWADKWLHRIRHSRKNFMFTAFVVLATMAVPHLYTTAVTLAFVLLAAAFYPSKQALAKWTDEKTRKHWYVCTQSLVNDYYSIITQDCHDNVDSGNINSSTQCTNQIAETK